MAKVDNIFVEIDADVIYLFAFNYVVFIYIF